MFNKELLFSIYRDRLTVKIRCGRYSVDVFGEHKYFWGYFEGQGGDNGICQPTTALDGNTIKAFCCLKNSRRSKNSGTPHIWLVGGTTYKKVVAYDPDGKIIFTMVPLQGQEGWYADSIESIYFGNDYFQKWRTLELKFFR